MSRHGLAGSAVGLEMPADGVCLRPCAALAWPSTGAALSLRPSGFHGMVEGRDRSRVAARSPARVTDYGDLYVVAYPLSPPTRGWRLHHSYHAGYRRNSSPETVVIEQ